MGSKRSGGGESGYVVRLREDLRQLLLSLPEAEETATFGDLAQRWLESIERVCLENEKRHIKHLNPLHSLREGELTVAEIDTALRLTGLGPTTVNKIRSTGKLIIAWAQANNRWRSPNPFALVRRRREIKRVWQTLSLPEVRRILEIAEGEWIPRVAVSVLLGLRPGELAAFLIDDVDFEKGSFWIHRSHGRNQTKTGKERRSAIPRCAEKYLRAAAAKAVDGVMFPTQDGAKMTRDARLSEGFRRLLKRAGIERMVRFYDLRHTSATLHREAGADPLVIRTTLGHANRNLTDDLYSHVSLEYQRAELSKLCICGQCARGDAK